MFTENEFNYAMSLKRVRYNLLTYLGFALDEQSFNMERSLTKLNREKLDRLLSDHELLTSNINIKNIETSGIRTYTISGFELWVKQHAKGVKLVVNG